MPGFRLSRLGPLVAIGFVLSGCFPPFGPFFPFPPMDEVAVAVENATDERWVLRISTDGFPVDFAVPAGGTGIAYPYPGTIDEIGLLDLECDEVASLEWTDTPDAVRIGPGAELEQTDAPADAPEESLAEYFDCTMGHGFGTDPEVGEALAGATGSLVVVGENGSAWILDPADAELAALVAPGDDGIDGEHVLSPDGTRVAFSRHELDGFDSSVVVLSLDGSTDEIVVNDAAGPSWSPDGGSIAFLDLDPFSGGSTLSVIDLEGGEPRVLAEDAALARWSPDGRMIAFISGTPLGFGEPVGSSELWVVNADGTGARTLAEAAPFADRPAWSPDGTRLAFLSGDELNTDLSVVALSGEPAVVADGDGAFLTEVTWAPNGGHLAFAIATSSLFAARGGIGVVDAGGGEISRLGEVADAYYMTPTWSPDGRWVAATRSVGMSIEFELVALSVDGAAEAVLATGITAVTEWRD